MDLFDHTLKEEEKVKAAFEKYGLTEEDKTFIKELILGEPLTEGGEGSQVIICSLRLRYLMGRQT